MDNSTVKSSDSISVQVPTSSSSSSPPSSATALSCSTFNDNKIDKKQSSNDLVDIPNYCTIRNTNNRKTKKLLLEEPPTNEKKHVHFCTLLRDDRKKRKKNNSTTSTTTTTTETTTTNNENNNSNSVDDPGPSTKLSGKLNILEKFKNNNNKNTDNNKNSTNVPYNHLEESFSLENILIDDDDDDDVNDYANDLIIHENEFNDDFNNSYDSNDDDYDNDISIDHRTDNNYSNLIDFKNLTDINLESESIASSPSPLAILEIPEVEAVNTSLLEQINNKLLKLKNNVLLSSSSNNHRDDDDDIYDNNRLKDNRDDFDDEDTKNDSNKNLSITRHMSLKRNRKFYPNFKRLTTYCTMRTNATNKLTNQQQQQQQQPQIDKLNFLKQHQLLQQEQQKKQQSSSSGGDGDRLMINKEEIVNYWNDPLKVEDCLLELDAYLDKIDDHDDDDDDEYNEDNHNDKNKNDNNNLNDTIKNNNTCNCNNNTLNDHICVKENVNNSVNQNEMLVAAVGMNSNTTDNDLIDNNNNQFNRGQHLRNTINYCNTSDTGNKNDRTFPRVQRHRNKLHHHHDRHHNSKDMLMTPQKEILWRRNSMRNICPMNMPDQLDDQINHHQQSLLESTNHDHHPILNVNKNRNTDEIPSSSSQTLPLPKTLASPSTSSQKLSSSSSSPLTFTSTASTIPTTSPQSSPIATTITSDYENIFNNSLENNNNINGIQSIVIDDDDVDDPNHLYDNIEMIINADEEHLNNNNNNNVISEPINNNNEHSINHTDNHHHLDLANEYLNCLTAQQNSSDNFFILHDDDTIQLNRSDSYNNHNNNNNNNNDVIRPRQMGRRAEDRQRIVSITAEINELGNQRLIINHNRRPNSAPSTSTTSSASLSRADQQQLQTVTSATTQRPEPLSSSLFIASEQSSIQSTRNPSPVSLLSTSESSAFASIIDDDDDDTGRDINNVQQQRQHQNRPTLASTSDNIDDDTNNNNNNNRNGDENNMKNNKQWPHRFSRVLAATCCTLGIFNISRFSIFSIHFGANFIVQFFILSIIFGIPMVWLQMCLGSKIRGGPITMWRISPISKGIGIALVIAQAIIAFYTSVSIGWILVYFRDSFVSRNLRYRWQDTFQLFRGPEKGSGADNDSVIIKLSETVADYFSGVVLQRYQIGVNGYIENNGIGPLRFQLAFNLAVLWIIVFVVLCKGLRSYGKIVLGLLVLPLIGLTALCIKMLTLITLNELKNIFPATDWQDFFINSQSWLSAAQETFLTWALFGSSIISIFSKTTATTTTTTNGADTISTADHSNRSDGGVDLHLRRDALIVVLITFFGLFLAAVLGNICVQLLNNLGYFYFPGSYENIHSYIFLLPSNAPLPPQLASTPSQWLQRYSSVLGEGFYRPGMNPSRESGYQALRMVTELFPATMAAAGQDQISSGWCSLGYLLFLFFAIGQLCAMWKPVSGILGHSTIAVLLSCVTGFILGIPFATESGISIIHYLDVILGGAWWILILWIVQIFAIFLVRGRPYSADLLVNDLRLTQTLSAFVALSWNVLLPIGLVILSIMEYKASYARELFNWRHNTYWQLWLRKLGAFIQIAFLLIVPLTSLIQMYRYLCRGPPDILERLQLLYRPSLNDIITGTSTTSAAAASSSLATGRYAARLNNNDRRQTGITLNSTPTIGNIEGVQQLNSDDAPPKYTPPPSYTTATGARIAKMLRNSIRRSVRRILGESSNNQGRRQRPAITTHNNNNNLEMANGTIQQQQQQPPPPAYSSVLINPSSGGGGGGGGGGDDIDDRNLSYDPDSATIQIQNDGQQKVLYNSHTHRSHTLELNNRQHRNNNDNFDGITAAIVQRQSNQRSRTLTARDVAQLLRTQSVNNNQQLLLLNQRQRQPLPQQQEQSMINNQPVETTDRPRPQTQCQRTLSLSGCVGHVLRNTRNSHNNNNNTINDNNESLSSRSVENLVLNAATIGESSAISLTALDVTADDSRNTTVI